MIVVSLLKLFYKLQVRRILVWDRPVSRTTFWMKFCLKLFCHQPQKGGFTFLQDFRLFSFIIQFKWLKDKMNINNLPLFLWQSFAVRVYELPKLCWETEQPSIACVALAGACARPSSFPPFRRPLPCRLICFSMTTKKTIISNNRAIRIDNKTIFVVFSLTP